MRSPPFPTVMFSGRFDVSARANLLRLIASVLLLTFTALPGFAMASAPAKKTADGSNLRQIGQASLIYAQDHRDKLPRATNVWDYAEQLAAGAGLGDPRMWLSREDFVYAPPSIGTILLPTRLPDPEFRKLKLAIAVPINANLSANAPATTPIAWTRGLQPDGTWSKDSPYKGHGGYIYFLGGNVAFYKNLGRAGAGEIARFDGQGTTNNILEALPPGSQISEYIPTQADRSAHERREFWSRILPALIAAIIWLNVVVIGACLWIKKILKPAPVLVTLIATTLVTAAVCLSVL